jgi:hypothetical protein
MPKRTLAADEIFEGKLNACADSRVAGGAYVITHVPTGCFYIGSTNDFYKRQCEHIYRLRAGLHRNPSLQRCYNQEPHFKLTFHLVGIKGVDLDIKENSLQLEQELIDRFKDNPLLLNVGLGALAPMLGTKHSKETKELMSFRKKGIMPECSVRKRRPVSIDDVVYESAREAGRQLGMRRQYVEKHLRDTLYPTWFYLDSENTNAENTR